MILNLGEFQIVTDERQFIVQKKRIVQASKMTKEANIGNEVIDNIAYCRTLNQCLKHVGNQIIMSNDSIQDILTKLSELNKTIDSFTGHFDIHEVTENEN